MAAANNLSAEKWAEIERLQGDAFEPALGEAFVAVPYAWWSAFRDGCAGDQDIFVSKEIDCNELLSEACPLALKRGLAENQDFTWVKEPVVAKLAEWGYDLKQTLRRVAVASPNGSAKIETYPQICVIRSSEAGVPAAAADPAAAAAPADAGAPSFTLLISRNAAPSAVLDAVLADAGAREALKLPGAGLRGLLRLHYREAEAISAAEARGDAAWTAGLSKLAAPAVATLGDAALNDEVLHLYVEMRKADGSWPLGPWWAPGFEPGLSGAADEPAWRKAVKVGSIVDAYDAGLKAWLEAEVIEVKAAGITGNIVGLVASGGAAGQESLVVHFRGWSRTATGLATMKRVSHDMMPPYTKAKPWRQGIRLGDEIEIAHAAAPGAAAAWFVGRVSALDFTVLPPTVTVVYGAQDPAAGNAIAIYERTVSLEDPDILSPHMQHWGDGTGRSGGGMHVRTTQYHAAKQALPAERFPFPLPGTEGVLALPAPFILKWSGASALAAGARGGAKPVAAGVYDDEAAAAGAGGARPAPAEAAKMFKARLSRYFGELEPAACRQVAKPGFCGLENLGNTCFMNSMLQCMAATMELSDYFLANEHLGEVNVANPLGSKGHMAMAYGALIHAMWSGAFNRVAPADVKALVGKRAPQFLGWAQQDSQEFMSFFLDLLLEDLCRVHPKPVIGELPTEGEEPELARLAWESYQRRNASRVADVFAGQFRSHVECNKCGRTSTTFDPFTSFSVPIPMQRWTHLDVFYFGVMNERPIKFTLHFMESEPPTGQAVAQWLVGKVREQFIAAAGAAAAGAAAGASPGGAAASAKPALGEPIDEDGDAAAGGSGEASSAAAAGGAGSAAASAAGAPSVAETDGEAGRGEYIGGRYVPKPWECLITLTTPADAMCMVHSTVPHWGIVSDAREAVRSRIARGSNSNVNVMVFVVPGSPSYAETAANPELHLNPEPDYDEKVAQADDDDEGFHRVQSKVVFKPRPKTPIGPVPRDYAILWLRRPIKQAYAGAPSFTAVGDCLIVPTRFFGGKRLEGDAVLTQQQMMEQALRAMKRLLLDQSMTADKLPGTLGWFTYIWEKRKGLFHDYANTGPISGTVKMTEDPIEAGQAVQWMLDLPDRSCINGEEARECTIVRSQAPREAQINLDACVRRFAVREQLGERDMWYCNRCKEHVRAYKKMDVWRLPPCLIIHLKRFQYERSFYGSVLRGKISELVDFPTRGLDMSPYLPAGASMPADGAIYDLYAVSEHSGGMGGGHYTATVFNQRTGQWMDCNDSSVRASDERSAVSGSAYVLFYRRRPVGARGPAHGPGRAPSAVAVPEGPGAAVGAAAPAIDSDEDQPTDQDDMQGPAYGGAGYMLEDRPM